MEAASCDGPSTLPPEPPVPVGLSEYRNDRGAIWEWAFVGSICLACLVYWCFHFHQFKIASPDSYAFIATARELWSGSLPSSYKRMPLFPLLIGLVAKFLPGEAPELQAALGLNLIFSIGELVFLYLVARRMLGAAAVLPVCLVAVSRYSHEMATQPLVEPIMSMTVLLALWLFARRSRWQYLAAGLAALTRYECSGLIAIFFVLNWAYERKPWRGLAFSALASSGFLIWMLLSVLTHRGGNPYLADMSSRQWSADLWFPLRVAEVSFAVWGREILSVGALLGAGLALRRKWRRESAAILLFALLYVGAHVFFGIGYHRFVHPIRWVLPLFMTVAALCLIAKGRKLIPQSWKARPAATWIATGLVLLAAGVSLYHCVRLAARNQGVAPQAVYIALPLVLLVAAGLHVALLSRIELRHAAMAAGVLAIVFNLQAGWGVAKHSRGSWETYYKHYSAWLAGNWLRENLKAGEKAMVPDASLSVQAGNLKPAQVAAFKIMKTDDMQQLRSELARRKVTYLIFTHSKPVKPDHPRYAIHVKRYRPKLFAPFAAGMNLPGFRHLAALEVPKRAAPQNVQIYAVE
jgi:hypothetical protein